MGTFVDIYDSADNYPEELWAAAEAYFKSLGDSTELALPGGRYASAQALAERRLPFLSGNSLGQLWQATLNSKLSGGNWQGPSCVRSFSQQRSVELKPPNGLMLLTKTNRAKLL